MFFYPIDQFESPANKHKHRIKTNHYDYIFEKLIKNAEPNEVVLFEDVNKYLQEGKKRGFITIGIDSGFGKDKLEADYVIDVRSKK